MPPHETATQRATPHIRAGKPGRPPRSPLTPEEKARVVAAAKEIQGGDVTMNLTTVLKRAIVEALPPDRRRVVNSVRDHVWAWFLVGMQAQAPAPSPPAVLGEIIRSTPDREPDGPPPMAEGLAELTPEDLAEVDPKILMRALEIQLLGRLDGLAGILLDLDSMFASLRGERPSNGHARVFPRSGKDAPNLRRLIQSRIAEVGED